MPLKSRLVIFIFMPKNIFLDVKKLSDIRLIYTKARVDVKNQTRFCVGFPQDFATRSVSNWYGWKRKSSSSKADRK